MKEDLLQYIWQFQAFDSLSLKTTCNQTVEIKKAGTLNLNSGPDFLNAQILINQQLWAGNVEIHLKSSHWDLHKHSVDSAYQNVILHVVYSHDKEIDFLTKHNIPTLELKSYVFLKLLNQYQKLQENQSFIPCVHSFSDVNEFTKQSWLNRLLIERLESKSNRILKDYKYLKDWEAIMFKGLAYSFGLKINSNAMQLWAQSFDFKLVNQFSFNRLKMNALFFGQAGFLNNDFVDEYPNQLKNEYLFLKKKYKLEPLNRATFQFFRLRPASFPTIRLAQLAALYNLYPTLFQQLIQAKELKDIVEVFQETQPNSYWDNHFRFDKESTRKYKKKISLARIHLIVLNCILPIRFAYQKYLGQEPEEDILQLYNQLPKEENKVIRSFEKIGASIKTATETQGYLQLYNEYCKAKKCLNCRIGHQILTHV